MLGKTALQNSMRPPDLAMMLRPSPLCCPADGSHSIPQKERLAMLLGSALQRPRDPAYAVCITCPGCGSGSHGCHVRHTG